MDVDLPCDHSPGLPPTQVTGKIKLMVKRGVECGPGLHLLRSAATEAAEGDRPGRGDGGPVTLSLSQKITDNIKGKVCSLAVCAVAWLVAHVRMLGLDEREKSLQMIRQLAGPLYSENTLQFYNERSVTAPPFWNENGTSRNPYLTPLTFPDMLLTCSLTSSLAHIPIHVFTH